MLLQRVDYCAFDFGTSNTVVAVHDGDGRKVILRDKSVLYFPDDSLPDFRVGREALAAYRRQGQTGRLLQSLKSLLPQRSFEGSRIGGSWRTIEELLALMMADFRLRASRAIGRPLRGAVLGRPARFSTQSDDEQLAVERLRLAAYAAGFEDVILVEEPIAAAMDFRRSMSGSGLALIADLGAGTSDFAVAQLEPFASGDGGAKVLSSSAVPVAGDDVDAVIVWNKLAALLGRGAKYRAEGKVLEVPARLHRDLCERKTFAFLRGQRNDLDLFIRRALRPEGLRRLADLIDEDLGYAMFTAVEEVKIQLKEANSATLRFSGTRLEVEREVSREDLFEWTRDLERQLLRCARGAILEASVSAADLGCVFLTGGTSLLHPMRACFEREFKSERVRYGDPFDAVVLGLLDFIPSV